MKKLAIGVAGVACLLASANAFAWNTTPVALTEVEFDSNTTLSYIRFASVPDGVPTCGKNTTWTTLSGTADGVKAMMALATASYLAGKSLRVNWSGTCDSAGEAYIIGLHAQ